MASKKKVSLNDYELGTTLGTGMTIVLVSVKTIILDIIVINFTLTHS